jgi:hypothetical protein
VDRAARYTAEKDKMSLSKDTKITTGEQSTSSTVAVAGHTTQAEAESAEGNEKNSPADTKTVPVNQGRSWVM